ncbi:MAG: cytoskeleton protein RodZ [Gammaproteobacteria bacterium]|jgi:cytoskeleton protein RodZ
MNESDTIEEQESSSAQTGPGDQLQAARIKQGLSIEDVATRMHLSHRILESIEENNFDDITAPIFVKGYLRAYARLVALDENEMIQRYVEYYSNEDPPINTTSNMAPEISAQDARIKWTTYLVIIVLIALLSAWWWNKTQNKTEVVSLDAEQSSVEVVIEPTEIETEFASDPGVEIDSSKLASVTNEPLEQDGTDPGLEDTGTAEEVVEPDLSESEVAIVVDQNDAIVETKPVEATDTASEISRVAPVGSDLLHIVVNADTWADIKDANDHRLVYDLLRANLTIELKGKAPFNAFFGNGHGVEILFNNESVDVAGYTLDDNTARLKIGTN